MTDPTTTDPSICRHAPNPPGGGSRSTAGAGVGTARVRWSSALALAALLSGCAAPGLQSPDGAAAQSTSLASTGSGVNGNATAASAPKVTSAGPAAAAPVLPAASVPAQLAADAHGSDQGPADAMPADDDPTIRRDLWDRIRKGYQLQRLDSDLVRKWEQYYQTRPDYVQRMTERASRYLYYIVEEVEKRGMPSEIALLPFVESAFNPQAKSWASASGMWQFMPGTGRDWRLRQNLFRDDRRNVLASTDAALGYLQQLNAKFNGDWHQALAAYNWGQGNVQRAIDRASNAGLPFDYASLTMPDETRNYVPKLEAIANIIARPHEFGLVLPTLENHPQLLIVSVERDIDLKVAARLAGMPVDEFQQYNPQMNKPVILASVTPNLLLPFDNALQYRREVESHKGPLASWTAWVAPRTLRIGEAARMVGMGESELRQANGIPPKMMVRAGSTLLIARAAESQRDVSQVMAEHAAVSFAPEPPPFIKIRVHAAKRGETVAAAARRVGVSPAQLAQWNRGVRANGKFRGNQAFYAWVPNNRSAIASAQAAPRASRDEDDDDDAKVDRRSGRKPQAVAAKSHSQQARGGKAAEKDTAVASRDLKHKGAKKAKGSRSRDADEDRTARRVASAKSGADSKAAAKSGKSAGAGNSRQAAQDKAKDRNATKVAKPATGHRHRVAEAQSSSRGG